MLCWAEYLEAEADAEVERGRVEAMLDVGCLVLPPEAARKLIGRLQ
jgi:hypothetical protein